MINPPFTCLTLKRQLNLIHSRMLKKQYPWFCKRNSDCSQLKRNGGVYIYIYIYICVCVCVYRISKQFFCCLSPIKISVFTFSMQFKIIIFYFYFSSQFRKSVFLPETINTTFPNLTFHHEENSKTVDQLWLKTYFKSFFYWLCYVRPT